MSISGWVTVKRKTAWVKRYAAVENRIFSYKNTATDKRAKYTADLRTARVMLGQQDDNKPYIFI